MNQAPPTIDERQSDAEPLPAARPSSFFPSVQDEDVRAPLIIGQTSVTGHDSGKAKMVDSKIIFFLGLLFAASGMVSPPVALVGGIAYGFSVDHPLRREASSLAKLLLQLSVILLGFGMNLNEVIRVGRSGFLYTAVRSRPLWHWGCYWVSFLRSAGRRRT